MGNWFANTENAIAKADGCRNFLDETRANLKKIDQTYLILIVTGPKNQSQRESHRNPVTSR